METLNELRDEFVEKITEFRKLPKEEAREKIDEYKREYFMRIKVVLDNK